MSDTRTEAERRYDAERDGSAYVKPEMTEERINALVDQIAPAIFARWAAEDAAAGLLDNDHTALAQEADRVIAEERGDTYTPLSPAWEAVLDIVADNTNDGAHQPFRQLADGTVIYGLFDTTKAGAGKRSGCVSVEAMGMGLTADSNGYLSGENRAGDDWTINFDGASLEDIRKLRTLLNSGAIEQLLGAAVAWDNGEPAK
jgi:hypothetical protein